MIGATWDARAKSGKIVKEAERCGVQPPQRSWATTKGRFVMTVPSVYLYDPDREDDMKPRPGFTAIYGLFDPRTLKLRYIGQTTNPRHRLAEHKSDAKTGTLTHREGWRRSLTRLGLVPLMQIIDWVPTEDWEACEAQHIFFARLAGCDLVNLTDGGKGVQGFDYVSKGGRSPITPEARARMSEAQKRRWADPEQRAAQRERMADPEIRKRTLANAIPGNARRMKKRWADRLINEVLGKP